MPNGTRDDEPDALDRLRAAAVAVFTGLSALIVLAAIAGDPVGEGLDALVFGTLLALLGVEGLVRITRNGP